MKTIGTNGIDRSLAVKQTGTMIDFCDMSIPVPGVLNPPGSDGTLPKPILWLPAPNLIVTLGGWQSAGEKKSTGMEFVMRFWSVREYRSVVTDVQKWILSRPGCLKWKCWWSHGQCRCPVLEKNSRILKTKEHDRIFKVSYWSVEGGVFHWSRTKCRPDGRCCSSSLLEYFGTM